MPDTCILTHLLFITALGRRFHYYPRITDEGNETQRLGHLPTLRTLLGAEPAVALVPKAVVCYSICQYVRLGEGQVPGKLILERFLVLIHFWNRVMRKLIPVEVYLQALILE